MTDRNSNATPGPGANAPQGATLWTGAVVTVVITIDEGARKHLDEVVRKAVEKAESRINELVKPYDVPVSAETLSLPVG